MFSSRTLATVSVSVVTALSSESLAQESSGDTPHELEGIVVEGRLVPETASPTGAVSSISKEELEKHEDDDVHQILLRVPGVQVRGEDGLGLRPNIGIRGTSPNRSTKIALLEDGIPLGPAPYSAPSAYYFPMMTRMTEVDVYKGGSSLLFGPRALGGAINMKTASIEAGTHGYLDVAGGQYGYFKAHGRGGYGHDRTGFLLEATHVQSSGFKELDGGGPTGFSKNEFMAKWRINSDPDAKIYHQLDVKFGFATEQSHETYLGLTDSDFRADPLRRYVSSELDEMNWHRGQFEATHTVLLSDAVELRTSVYQHLFARDWFKLDQIGGTSLDDVLSNPDSPTNLVYYDVITGSANSGPADEDLYITDNYRWYTVRGIQTALQMEGQTGAIAHELLAGARLHYDEANRLHTRHFYAMTGASTDQLGHLEPTGKASRTITDNQGATHALSLYAVDRAQFEDWTFSPGVRVEAVFTRYEDKLYPELDNKRTQIGILPGMGVHYAFNDNWGAFTGAYRGYGPVAPQGVEPGAAKPKPESSTILELGGRYSAEIHYLEAVGFYNRYGNLTAECTESRGCSAEDTGDQFDGGRADVFGLELTAMSEPRLNKLFFPLRATTALSWGIFRNDFVSGNPEWGTVTAGDQLPYLPRFQGTVSAGVRDASRFSFEVGTVIASASREVAGSGPIPEAERTDPYALLNLLAQVTLVGPLSLYGKGTNLLNQAYLTSRRPYGARPGAPLWIQVGLKFEE